MTHELYVTSLRVRQEQHVQTIAGDNAAHISLMPATVIYDVTLEGDYIAYRTHFLKCTGSSCQLNDLFNNGVTVPIPDSNISLQLIPISRYNITVNGIGPYAKVSINFSGIIKNDIIVKLVAPTVNYNITTHDIDIPDKLPEEILMTTVAKIWGGYLEGAYLQHWYDVKIQRGMTGTSMITYVVRGLLYKAIGYAPITNILSVIQNMQYNYLDYTAIINTQCDTARNIFYLQSMDMQDINMQWIKYTITGFPTVMHLNSTALDI